MLVAFSLTPSLPINPLSHSLSTPRRPRSAPRVAYPRPFSPTARHPVVSRSSDRENFIQSVDAQLRALNAPAAADLLYISLTGPTDLFPPPSWPQLLQVLRNHGVVGRALSLTASRLGILKLLSLDPNHVHHVLSTLEHKLSLTQIHISRIVSKRPFLLQADCDTLSNTIEELLTIFNASDARFVSQTWPGILAISGTTIKRIITYLLRPPASMRRKNLRSLFRRAPWLLVYDIDTDIVPALSWLSDNILLHTQAPASHFILAAPLLLGTHRSSLTSVLTFLKQNTSLDDRSLASTVRAFPPLLTCNVDQVLRPAADYLRSEVAFDIKHLTKVVRAFPAILTLDVETRMRPIVEYFHSKGVQNVGRIVLRLPPVLGYDVDTDVNPKMLYIETVLGLSTYDVLKFPGYFSYDLAKVIEPRTRFLQTYGKSVAEVGLNMALALTDEQFCLRVARAPLSKYLTFKETYFQNLRLRRDAEAGDVYPTSLIRPSFEESGIEIFASGKDRRKRRFRATPIRLPWEELR